MSENLSPTDGAVFDLSARSKFRVTGADRLRFLNGQVTNDVRRARADEAVHACVITAKGKTNGDLFVSAQSEFLLLDTDERLRESLAARLERYIIADDVQLEDVSDKFALFHVLAPAGTPLPNGTVIRAERWGMPGWDVWTAVTDHDATLERLAQTWPVFEIEAAEVFRIEQGIPRWGCELTEEIIPVEAGLEAGCVDYAKGCYIGQEVISRMKMSGQTNKRLCGFVSQDASPLAAGMRLTTMSGERKDVGWLTSATWSDRRRQWIALGYAKRGYNDPGTGLVATSDASLIAQVRLLDLPFE